MKVLADIECNLKWLRAVFHDAYSICIALKLRIHEPRLTGWPDDCWYHETASNQNVLTSYCKDGPQIIHMDFLYFVLAWLLSSCAFCDTCTHTIQCFYNGTREASASNATLRDMGKIDSYQTTITHNKCEPHAYLWVYTLVHWGRHIPDHIFKWISWMKIYEFRLQFHWSLFLRV